MERGRYSSGRNGGRGRGGGRSGGDDQYGRGSGGRCQTQGPGRGYGGRFTVAEMKRGGSSRSANGGRGCGGGRGGGDNQYGRGSGGGYQTQDPGRDYGGRFAVAKMEGSGSNCCGNGGRGRGSGRGGEDDQYGRGSGGGCPSQGPCRGFGGDIPPGIRGRPQRSTSDAPPKVGVHERSSAVTRATDEDKENIELWIHIRFFNCSTRKRELDYRWLRFDVGKKSMTMFKDSTDSNSYLHSGTESVNEYMYAIGRLTNNATDIFRLNTRDYEGGWKKVADAALLKEIDEPAVRRVNGKLYIFDRQPGKLKDTQVYDPFLETVSALPQISERPHMDQFMNFMGADDDQDFKRLIFWSYIESNLLFYYPDEEKWDEIGHPADHGETISECFYNCSFGSSTHRGTFCWLGVDRYGYSCTEYLVSYDYQARVMSDKVPLVDIIPGYKSVLSAPPTSFQFHPLPIYSQLYHLSGDMYCLIWCKPRCLNHDSYLYCTLFRISNVCHKQKLVVHDASTLRYKMCSAGCYQEFKVKAVVPLHMNCATACTFNPPHEEIELSADEV